MPSAGMGSHVWVDKILPKVVDRIVGSVKSLQKDRVFQSLFDDSTHVEYPVADRFVTLKVLEFPVRQEYVDGGGNINTLFESSLVVTAFVRLEADPEEKSTVNLQDEAKGVYTFLRQIAACLQTWEGPTDSVTGLAMLARPMRLSPGFRISPKGGHANTRWTVCPMTFNLPFVGDMGVDYP